MLRLHCLVAAALLAGAPPAFAHAMLRKAVPAVGSTVRSAPTEIDLFFSEGVEPGLSRITVRDAAGTAYETGEVHTAPGNAKELIGAVRTLPAGAYTVEWHATSVDTHKTEGRFSFTVAP